MKLHYLHFKEMAWLGFLVFKKTFETLANEKINIIITTQASSEHSICIGVLDSDAKLQLLLTKNLKMKFHF